MDIEIFKDFTNTPHDFEINNFDSEFKVCSSLLAMICVSGKGYYKFHFNEVVISHNDLLIIPPNIPFYPVRYEDNFKINLIRIGAEHFEIVDQIIIRPQFELLLGGVPQLHVEEIQFQMLQSGMSYIKYLLDNLDTYSDDEKTYTEQIIKGFVNLFFLEACRLLSKDENGRNQHVRQDAVSRKFFHEISKHHKQRLTVEFYARQIGITPKRLSHTVLENTGKSASEWIDQFSLMQAKRMLRTMDLSIQEIAYDLDFATPSHFTKFFKNKTGMTPSEFKKSL
ncbi:MAG: helix-turn-helix domain-containing protein [Candidatus Cryptobacteroides sp.]